MPHPNRLDLESQIFGILKTLRTIHEDVQLGKISYPKYCSTVHQKIKELLLVEMTFQAKGFEFETILQDMMISEEFFKLIPQIHEYITLKEQKTIPDKVNETKLSEFEQNLRDATTAQNKTTVIGNVSINPLLLAELASEITGGFITIFDFFKMELKDYQFLRDRLLRIQKALKRFPGLDEVYLDFVSLIREVNSKNITDPKQELYESFEQLYRRYLAFLKKPSNL